MIEIINGAYPDTIANWREMAAYCRSIYLRDHPNTKAADMPVDFLIELKDIIMGEPAIIRKYNWQFICSHALCEIMDMIPPPAYLHNMKHSFTGLLNFCLHEHRIPAFETFDVLLNLSSSLSPRIVE